MSNIKRLERSRSDRMVSGVCGGIARQFNFDTVVVRIVFVIIGLIPGMLGFAAIAYVAAIFLIPEEPETGAANTQHPGWRYDPWTGEPISTHTAQSTPDELTAPPAHIEGVSEVSRPTDTTNQ